MNDALLARFVEEARDLLKSAAAGLLVLERNPGDPGAINEVFRAVHTLKGSSGLFDAPALTRLVHAGEDLLSAVRVGDFRLDATIVDQLLDSFDQVAVFIDQMADNGRLNGDADRVATHGAGLLRAHLGETVVTTAAPDAVLAPVPESWLAGFDPVLLGAARLRPDAVLVLRYMPDAGCFYTGTDPITAIQQVPGILGMVIAPHAPWAVGDAFDPYHCNLCITLITTADRDTVEQVMTYELDEIEIRVLTAAPVPVPVPAAVPGAGPVRRLSPPVRHIIVTQMQSLARTGYDPVRLRSTQGVVTNVLRSLGHDLLVAEWEEALTEARAREDAAPLTAFLSTLGAREDGDPQPAAPSIALTVAPPPPQDGDHAAVGASATPPAAASAVAEARPASRTLKVDQGKVDLLMNLIGELVVSKNALPFLAARAEDVHGSREMAREIKEQHAIFDRLTQELQSAIMQVRMLPVSEIFGRLPRLVRDTARKLTKQVDLVIEGEDTAADKTIVEALGDPLLHIVRNSLDHGIESPEARIAADKPAAATLRLRAWQETDSVIIEIGDDGRGIDPARIRAAAVAKGVIEQDEAERLSDQEAINLIYRPGFSTAAEVTDLSGRGVGMDVVLSTVQKLGGRVSVTSTLGQGTTTRLTMPLSMAVTRVMVVDVGGSLYGVPMDIVVQTVRLSPDTIHHVRRDEVFVLRDEVVPLVRMRSLLGGDPPTPGDAARIDDRGEAVLVCRYEGRTVGLVIDDFREGMDVILKPMDGILATIPGYCGTTLLGDGRVLLVLDLKEML